jgi:CheY-like chemotaxis protein
MNADRQPTVLMITGDLVFSSRVTGVAETLGVRLQVEPAFNGSIESRSIHETAVLILDLSTPGLDVAAVMAALAEQARPVVIAYAAHVAKSRLEEARAAGCDEVLTRGQFASRVMETLERHLAQ